MANTQNNNTIIPFTLVDHRIIIKCLVNGQEVLLLFDTGASNSFLLPEEVNHLQLKQIGYDIVTTSDGSKFKSPIFLSTTFEIGDVKLNDIKILSSDLPYNLKCIGVKGFLGANVINKINWKINFDKQIIEISKSPFTTNESISIKYIKNNPIMQLTIEDETFDFIIDFGYWGDLTMNATQLNNSKFSKHSSKSSIVTQDVQNNKIIVLTKLNDYLLKKVLINDKLITDQVVISGWDFPVSFIGMSFLSRFNITINSSDSTYTFRPRENYSLKQNPLLYNFGFKPSFNGKDLFASEFYEAVEPALISSLSAKIIKIDGYNVEMFRKNPCFFNNFLNYLTTRDTIKITFETGAEEVLNRLSVKFQ